MSGADSWTSSLMVSEAQNSMFTLYVCTPKLFIIQAVNKNAASISD